MKMPRQSFVISILLALFGICILVLILQPTKVDYWHQILPFLRELDASLESHKKRGQSPPAPATVEELVRNGYITAKSTRGMEDATVAFMTPDMTRPQSIKILLQLRDGRRVALLVDGGIHQIPNQAAVAAIVTNSEGK